jgi:hypothetical protein
MSHSKEVIMSRHDSREIENVKVMLVKGDSGSTIVSIEKTGTSGLVDTYTITMSDGSKSTFTVSNGKEIVSVEKTGTSGLVDTYTMTFNDESTETFEVVNGNGIASIEKTGTQGAVDTYTITLDDGTTYTFTVTNATGTVDSDFSETSENPVQNRVITNKIKAMDDNIAGTENGATASQTYVAGEFILRNNQLYKVTTAIATGDALTDGVNISADSVGEELQQINADVEQINSDLNNKANVSDLENYQTKAWSTIGSGDNSTPLNYNISNYSEIAILINAASASLLEPHYYLTVPSNFITSNNVRFILEGGVGTDNLVYATISKTQISISVKLGGVQQSATFAVVAR